MSINNDYITNTLVKQRISDLHAEAASDRLGREVRPNRRSWLRRLVDAVRPTNRYVPVEPAAEPTQRPAEVESADSEREPVGAGRVNGI